ncbi:hypothetical protein EVA_02596 [gut metagenome]|uniref:Uncharacterized protein n=1 Tax=gut metagenome TaxID=749906 RepID=J9D8Z0_9ZZZZ
MFRYQYENDHHRQYNTKRDQSCHPINLTPKVSNINHCLMFLNYLLLYYIYPFHTCQNHPRWPL